MSGSTLGFPISTLPLRPLDSGGLALLPTWLCGSRRAPDAGRGGDALGSPRPGRGHRPGRRRVRHDPADRDALGAAARPRRMHGGSPARDSAAIQARELSGSSSVAVVDRHRQPRRSFWAPVEASTKDDRRRTAARSRGSTESPLVGGGPATYGVRTDERRCRHACHSRLPGRTQHRPHHGCGIGDHRSWPRLLLTAVLFGLAVRRSWTCSTDRSSWCGALIGLAVLIGHGMVDVVIGLVGSWSSRHWLSPLSPRPTRTAAASDGREAGASLRTRRPRHRRRRGDRPRSSGRRPLSQRSPGPNRSLERRSTGCADPPDAASTRDLPDLVPAWWAQMIAADAAGDADAARAAADSDWQPRGIRPGVDAGRGPRVASRRRGVGAATRSIEPPVGRSIDPIVQLNAAVLLDALGDRRGGAGGR